MTSEEAARAAERYSDAMKANPEVEVGDVGESQGENRGITRVRHFLIVALTAIVCLIVGASTFAFTNFWHTRPNPIVSTLTTEQHQALLAAADPNNRGFNDGAIGTLQANGFGPVAQSVDRNTDTFYIVLVKCTGDYRLCAEQIHTTTGPVVYLGIPDELSAKPTVVRFIAAQVQVDFPLNGNRVQRCAVYRGKAIAGEPGPVTYNLHQTLAILPGFAGERTFDNESPDGDGSFWSCGPEDRG